MISSGDGERQKFAAIKSPASLTGQKDWRALRRTSATASHQGSTIESYSAAQEL
jgi:hypothetical protein